MPIVNLIGTADTLKWIFLIFPHFALGNCLHKMHLFRITVQVCKLQCQRININEVLIPMDMVDFTGLNHLNSTQHDGQRLNSFSRKSCDPSEQCGK